MIHHNHYHVSGRITQLSQLSNIKISDKIYDLCTCTIQPDDVNTLNVPLTFISKIAQQFHAIANVNDKIYASATLQHNPQDNSKACFLVNFFAFYKKHNTNLT